MAVQPTTSSPLNTASSALCLVQPLGRPTSWPSDRRPLDRSTLRHVQCASSNLLTHPPPGRPDAWPSDLLAVTARGSGRPRLKNMNTKSLVKNSVKACTKSLVKNSVKNLRRSENATTSPVFPGQHFEPRCPNKDGGPKKITSFSPVRSRKFTCFSQGFSPSFSQATKSKKSTSFSQGFSPGFSQGFVHKVFHQGCS